MRTLWCANVSGFFLAARVVLHVCLVSTAWLDRDSVGDLSSTRSMQMLMSQGPEDAGVLRGSSRDPGSVLPATRSFWLGVLPERRLVQGPP
jgi:hypothetical protein